MEESLIWGGLTPSIFILIRQFKTPHHVFYTNQIKWLFYLYEVLKVVWVHAGEIQQEFLAHVLQLQVLVLLLGGLQGAEHHRPQHQVQEHPGEDAEQGGAAHCCTSTQSKHRLLFPPDSLSVGTSRIPAANETSVTTKTPPQLMTSSGRMHGVDLSWPQEAFNVLHWAKTADSERNTPVKSDRQRGTYDSASASSGPSWPRAAGWIPWSRNLQGHRPLHSLRERTLEQKHKGLKRNEAVTSEVKLQLSCWCCRKKMGGLGTRQHP